MDYKNAKYWDWLTQVDKNGFVDWSILTSILNHGLEESQEKNKKKRKKSVEGTTKNKEQRIERFTWEFLRSGND